MPEISDVVLLQAAGSKATKARKKSKSVTIDDRMLMLRMPPMLNMPVSMLKLKAADLAATGPSSS